MQTIDNRRLLLRGDPVRGIALLWHGRGVYGAAWMLPLAERIAARGVLALAANWNSESVDRGRADLLTSLYRAQDLAVEHGHDPGELVVAGWSLGGTAAMGLAVHAERLGVKIGGIVLIAPGDGKQVIDPISGLPLPATVPPGASGCTVDLIYGERDTGATPDLVSGLELRLRASGWATSMHALDTDHAGVIGTRFDERTEQYVPAMSAHAVTAVDEVAAVIVQAVSR